MAHCSNDSSYVQFWLGLLDKQCDKPLESSTPPWSSLIVTAYSPRLPGDPSSGGPQNTGKQLGRRWLPNLGEENLKLEGLGFECWQWQIFSLA